MRHFVQRGIYLTFGDACVIISICKANLRHQMCPKRLPEEHKTSVPLVRRRHLRRVGPSTRGATAPQRAQQVNFVVRSGSIVKISEIRLVFSASYSDFLSFLLSGPFFWIKSQKPDCFHLTKVKYLSFLSPSAPF